MHKESARYTLHAEPRHTLQNLRKLPTDVKENDSKKMQLTAILRGWKTRTISALGPKYDWKKPWFVGYRGRSLPKRRGTDIPFYPVSARAVASMREALHREWNVMKCLSTPYISRECEAAYIAEYGPLEQRQVSL